MRCICINLSTVLCQMCGTCTCSQSDKLKSIFIVLFIHFSLLVNYNHYFDIINTI